MVNKDGKVFGKINIVDLIIIIVLVACAGLFVYTNTFGKDPTSTTDKSIIFEFYTDEAPDYVISHVLIGSKIYDNDANLELGKVTSVETGPSVIYNTNYAGEEVVSTREGYSSITITGKVKSGIGDFGVEIGGVKYGVGHSMTFRAGTAKIFLKISDIREG